MTRKILIEIPGAGDVNCDGCILLNEVSSWGRGGYCCARECAAFHIKSEPFSNNMPRPQTCLDAEKAAMKRAQLGKVSP